MDEFSISAYTYPLPADRIARYPLQDRDQSKLLVYKNGILEHDRFFNLTTHLPPNSSLYFNNTKVIPARLYFQKETGADIEIFLLHPVTPSTLLVETMNSTRSCTWRCTIGNLKRWKDNTTLTYRSNDLHLRATLIDRETGMVSFQWDDKRAFAEVLSFTGETPLPPYLKRKAETSDRERYQTIYSKNDGAVAAPTAGLHFTPEVFQSLKDRSVSVDFLTLHVSAGTFQPIKTEDVSRHVMHQEQVVVTKSNVMNLLQQDKVIIPVGTTSMRTLESLYWFGAKLLENPNAVFQISQRDPYTSKQAPPQEEALTAILHYMEQHNLETIVGETAIYIMPGYKFRICKGLITNFHQPESTLIVLVAAFIGKGWKRIYSEALEKDYRFLSYGDSSLLLP
ncbi:MAG TPA: S-adenosylmethionine:tRNA ribosyltransferase-isomerase [Ohtaekwangia sp.]|nr:S-adenosylmethionine:tRNA ribosyltransferase-isomerase [Ohtaekwangia sp.]